MAIKPHPESSPHYAGDSGQKNEKKLKGRKEPTGARRIMSGPGFFFDDTLVPEPEAPPPQVSQPEPRQTFSAIETNEPRTLRFLKGTELFVVIHDKKTKQIVIPYSTQQARKLLREILDEDRDLVINEDEGMVDGARGTRVIRKVGVSQFGAFTVVDWPIGIADGHEVITEKRLASMTTRSQASKVQKGRQERFENANSPVPPHLQGRDVRPRR